MKRWMWVCLWILLGALIIVSGLRFVHHWSEKQDGE
jgi:hypothetical protein